MTIRVLLAEDHAIVREGLRAMLIKETDLEVVGEAENGRSAVQLASELLPDVVVMDVMLPELNGIEATRKILAARPETAVIALSMHADRRYVRRMFQVGAKGYLLKEGAFEELSRAIRDVLKGGRALSPKVADLVVEDYIAKGKGGSADEYSSLTDREREVLQLVAEGVPTREIAARLDVSIKTVETHRRKIMERLKIRSVAGLTKFAVRVGLTTLEL